jgi:hypothetical protein
VGDWLLDVRHSSRVRSDILLDPAAVAVAVVSVLPLSLVLGIEWCYTLRSRT